MPGTARTVPAWWVRRVCDAVQYDLTGALAERCRGGVLAEHLHCRAQAALFDVSHMARRRWTGNTAAAALETLVPGDIAGLNRAASATRC